MNDNENKTPDAASYPDDNPKTLTGVTKAPLHLVPPVSIQAEAEAFADGANKYGPYNWREKTVSASIYVAAAKRHIDAWWDGEEVSRDAQVLHLGHAKACLSILIDAMSIGKLNDDRPPKGAAADWQQEYADKNKKEPNGAEQQITDAKEVGILSPGRRWRDRRTRVADAIAESAKLAEPFHPVEHRRLSDLQEDLRSGYAAKFIYGDNDGEVYYTADGGVERYDIEGHRLDSPPVEGRVQSQ